MSNLVYYSLYFVSLFLAYYLIIIIIRYMSGLKFSFKISVFDVPIFIAVTILGMLFEFNNLILLKSLIIITSTIFILMLEYKIKLKKILTCYILLLVLAMLFELLLGFFLGIIMDFEKDSYEYLLIRILTNVYYYLLILIILRILKSKKTYGYIINVSFRIVLIVLILLLIVGTNNYLITYNNNIKVYFLFLALLMFIVGAVYLIIKLIKNNYNKKIEICNLKGKNSEVITYINEFKTYQHNLKYHLLAMKGNGNSKVNKQIDELLDSNNSELEYINNFKEVPSSLIHVFSHCLTLTNDNDISISIRNNYKDKELIINQNYYLKLNEVIGNCITNAIEALPDENGILLVEFYEINGVQYIRIANNFDSCIDIEKIGCRNYSTKNRNSGFGLNSIFANRHLEVTGKIINNFFVMNIKIPK